MVLLDRSVQTCNVDWLRSLVTIFFMILFDNPLKQNNIMTKKRLVTSGFILVEYQTKTK